MIRNFSKNHPKIKLWLAISISLLLSACATSTLEGDKNNRISGYSNAKFSSSAKQIALLLPLTHGSHAGAAKAVQDGVMTAYKRDIASGRTIRLYNTGDEKNVANLYRQAVHDGADIVIGPLTKDGVSGLASGFSLPVPVIALNTASSKSLHTNNLIQFGLQPEDEVKQIAQRAIQDGKFKSLVLVPNSNLGARLEAAFKWRYGQLGGEVLEVAKFNPNQDLAKAVQDVLNVDQSQARANALQRQLGSNVNFEPRRRQDVDMIFLASDNLNATQIVPLIKFYYAYDIPVYATSSVYKGIFSDNTNRDLNGIYICDMPWVLSPNGEIRNLREEVATIWPEGFANYNRLYALGIDAYRLLFELDNLKQLPNQGYPGVTGTLFLDNNNTIYRKLMWAKINNGHARVIN